MDIRDEAVNVISNELRRKEDDKFYLISDMSDIEYLCSKENIPIIKDKIYKLVEKLNSSSEKEIYDIMYSDFQDEIWDKL